jgi:uncharacterized protein
MFVRMIKILILVGAAAVFGLAMAQSEPTLNQVYEAAQAGRIGRAQEMMKQVLRDHPTSGKAHYVEAELLARQKLFDQARQELATAETLAPGLPFAKPSAVHALRSELSAPTSAAPAMRDGIRAADAAPVSSPVSAFPWGLALGLGGIAAVLFVIMKQRRSAVNAMPSASYPPGQVVQPGAVPGTSNAPGYGQPGYGQATPGMGSNLMGGLATGLAVGAGVVAAEQIGHRLFGSEHAQGVPATGGNQGFPPDENQQMGGDNFGITDDGGWNDGGSADLGGGGWDS